jgi:hypothetical protein
VHKSRIRPGGASPKPLRDEGARHDDALVDVELVGAEPGFADEIGRGLARADALVDQLARRVPSRRVELVIEMRIEIGERQAERVEDEPRGLVERIRGSVAIGEARLVEPLDRFLEERADGPARGHRAPSSSATARR